MITLAIILTIMVIIGIVILAIGGSILLIFIDPIICGLILYGIYKLIKWIKSRS